MLYFSLAETGELIETLSLEDIQWLVKMRILKEGSTGFIKDDGVQILPFFEDYKLTYLDAISMRDYSHVNIQKMMSTSGFYSTSLEKFCKILDNLIESKKTIKVRCS